MPPATLSPGDTSPSVLSLRTRFPSTTVGSCVSTRDPENDAQEDRRDQAHQEALPQRKLEPIPAAVEYERRHDTDEQLKGEIEHSMSSTAVTPTPSSESNSMQPPPGGDGGNHERTEGVHDHARRHADDHIARKS